MSKNYLKAVQCIGQIVVELLKQLTDKKFTVNGTNGPKYIIGYFHQFESKLRPETGLSLDMTILSILRYLQMGGYFGLHVS